jgi:hypothetical protein
VRYRQHTDRLSSERKNMFVWYECRAELYSYVEVRGVNLAFHVEAKSLLTSMLKRMPFWEDGRSCDGTVDVSNPPKEIGGIILQSAILVPVS